MSRWICSRCEHSYSPREGDLAHGIAPGTPWESLPEDWICPDCGAPKFEFSQAAESTPEGSGWTVS